jgi:hypothetical protein
MLFVWVCAFPVIFLVHSRLLLESVCRIIDHLARTGESLCTSAVERTCTIAYLVANLAASIIYLVCTLMKGGVEELDSQISNLMSPIYLSFFFFCVVTGFGLLIVFPSVSAGSCFGSPQSAALGKALTDLILFDTLCVTMGAIWQWVLEPVRLHILARLFGAERENRSAVLSMARVDLENPAETAGMDSTCSICLGDLPGDTNLSLETAVEGDIVQHTSGRCGEVSIESSQVIVNFDGPKLPSEGWSMRPVVRLPCRHCFHLKCATDWISRRPSCPVCRARVVGHAAVELHAVPAAGDGPAAQDDVQHAAPRPVLALPPDLQPALELALR